MTSTWGPDSAENGSASTSALARHRPPSRRHIESKRRLSDFDRFRTRSRASRRGGQRSNRRAWRRRIGAHAAAKRRLPREVGDSTAPGM